MDVYVWDYSAGKAYQVTPHRDHVVCDAYSAADGPEVGDDTLRPVEPSSTSAARLGAANHAARTPAVGAAFAPHHRAAELALEAHHGAPRAAELLSAFGAADESPLIPLLPDVGDWEYRGVDSDLGEPAHVWYHEDSEFSKASALSRLDGPAAHPLRSSTFSAAQ